MPMLQSAIHSPALTHVDISMFKCAYLKFMLNGQSKQTKKHTHTHVRKWVWLVRLDSRKLHNLDYAKIPHLHHMSPTSQELSF